MMNAMDFPKFFFFTMKRNITKLNYPLCNCTLDLNLINDLIKRANLTCCPIWHQSFQGNLLWDKNNSSSLKTVERGSRLKELTLTLFKQPEILGMYSMFNGCSKFNNDVLTVHIFCFSIARQVQ